MARKPDKRVYVRRNRARKKLNLRRRWAPISSRKNYKLQAANLKLISELEEALATS
jgi:hypothetical protein